MSDQADLEKAACSSPSGGADATGEQEAVAELPGLEMQGDEAHKGSGEPPLDPPFATLVPPFTFWQDAVLLALLGAALGAFGWSYLKAISEVTGLWLSADGNAAFPDPASLQFGAGRAWWVGVCGGAGLAVGLAKVALGLDDVPSFITELRTLHIDLVPAAKTAAVTLLGLLGGVPMGPEAGLGAAAGVAGVLLARLRGGFRLQADLRSRLYILSSMTSAFASLMPNPLCGVLLVMELGRPSASLASLPYMHLVCMLAVGATCSFVVYYAIQSYTYLAPLLTFFYGAEMARYKQLFIVEGILFGIMGAAFALVYVLMAGVAKGAGAAARRGLDARVGKSWRIVMLTTIAGAATGAMGWAMPLVLTDGSAQLGVILGEPQQVGAGVLAASAFAKAMAYHICAECGFLGGLFLPMLAMSSMLGGVFVATTGVDRAVAAACSLVALPAALCPMPAMLSLLALSIIMVGPQGLIPIFATTITAHLLFLGVGLPQGMLAWAARRQQAH